MASYKAVVNNKEEYSREVGSMQKVEAGRMGDNAGDRQILSGASWAHDARTKPILILEEETQSKI